MHDMFLVAQVSRFSMPPAKSNEIVAHKIRERKRDREQEKKKRRVREWEAERQKEREPLPSLVLLDIIQLVWKRRKKKEAAAAAKILQRFEIKRVDLLSIVILNL